MKKMILPGLVLFLLTSIKSGTHAQLTYNTKQFRPETAFESNTSSASNVTKDPGNLKAIKNFNTTFENATDIKWSRLNNGGSLVHFLRHEIETKVFYNKGGNKVGMIRYYREDKLPSDVRHLVKSTYYDFSIFLVIEVTVNNKRAYLVKIEDNTCSKTIRVMDGEMNVIEEFEKR